ncbi:hypothetical protein PIB30_108898, partial [Stylosanthes scabra]|nr:hypothetical protein [Stylosanthes scabra]
DYMAAQREEIPITSSMSTDTLTGILGAIKDLADTVRCQSESNREFLEQIMSGNQNGEVVTPMLRKHLSTQTTIDCQSLRKTHHPLFMANMIQS